MEQSNRSGSTQPTLTILSLTKISLISAILCFSIVSCKKADNDDNLERDYGYAKVMVKCENCTVSYTSAGQLNNFPVDGNNTAVNYIRYKKDYTLDINIKSLGANQNLNLSVYSRSGKQVFLKSMTQNANETWNSKIIIP